jgi:hypothetical protein
MKKFLLYFIFIVILFSCENEKKYPDSPDWLLTRISIMKTPDYYFGTSVYAYKWNREYFYLISIPLSSCMMCEFYNYSGNKVVWTEKNTLDFQKNGERIREVWHRPN